ncbi:hypothetical protein LguiA_025821 [Lonicera macranthoides]
MGFGVFDIFCCDRGGAKVYGGVMRPVGYELMTRGGRSMVEMDPWVGGDGICWLLKPPP